MTLALRDYLRKTSSLGFTVSLSGGCDSAAVAYLVASMVHRGVRELGWESYLATIGISDQGDRSVPRLVGKLLTCVYQATENSSQTTEIAATSLAGEIGADFHRISTQKIVDFFTSEAELSLGQKLTWKK